VKRKNTDWPIKYMKPGESFVVGNPQDRDRVRQAMSKYKTFHPGFEYTTKKIEDGKYRIWRLS